ncbi:MAG: trehalose-phosphatase [Firmicutes bacterium]|nr:trehalose-phosphatase [Bacillota bacterium]
MAGIEPQPRTGTVGHLISALENEERLGRRGKLLAAMDYDGTLVPFALRPEQAVPGLRVLEVLNRLVSRSDVVVAIISGRTLVELEEFLPLQPIWLSALHGAVVSPPGKKPEWLIDPGCIELLQDRIKHISHRLNDLPDGFRIEDKGLSLAIHFRGVPREQVREGLERLLPAIDSLIDREIFELLPGSEVVEIRPLNVNKGKAVSFIADSNPDCLPFYLGDDITDEDAFRTLGENGFTIRVSSEIRPTAARWQLPIPDHALDFLDRLPGVMDRINASRSRGGRR